MDTLKSTDKTCRAFPKSGHRRGEIAGIFDLASMTTFKS